MIAEGVGQEGEVGGNPLVHRHQLHFSARPAALPRQGCRGGEGQDKDSACLLV